MLIDRARTGLMAFGLAVLGACGGGGGDDGGDDGGGTPPAPPPAPPAPLVLSLQEVASVTGAVFLTAPTGDTRQFIVERRGRVRILRDGVLLDTPFLDISARVSTRGEGGLLSIAFDPQYASTGSFFLYYTDLDGNIVIERQRVSSNRNVADPDWALPLLRIPHPGFTNHYGGLLSFGPDGFLYLGTGDGGSAGDPPGNAQNLNTLLGKMLRIDVTTASGFQLYLIPASNPYVGQLSRRPEIWAHGLRNPWRFAFDSGRLYIADVGQSRREEVNIVNAATGGLNFGWNRMEGSLCFSGSCDRTGLTLPTFEYAQGTDSIDGCSVTGGYVYRGKAIPELAGRYFYSDYCAGFLKSFLFADDSVSEQRNWLIANVGNILSFGLDADGELYLVAGSGKIYRIIRAPAT